MSNSQDQENIENELDLTHEKEKKKNFLQVFIGYFKYQKKLHKRINQSLLFNSYVTVKLSLIWLKVLGNRVCAVHQILPLRPKISRIPALLLPRLRCLLPLGLCAESLNLEYDFLQYHPLSSDLRNRWADRHSRHDLLHVTRLNFKFSKHEKFQNFVQYGS